MHETRTLAELVTAGWSEADLQWEKLSEAALAALAEGQVEPARELYAQALRVARTEFPTNDPRLAASLSNQAVVQPVSSGRIEASAAQAWASCGRWIDTMTAPRTARSSLFHLRMERLHRPAYEERWRMKARDMLETLRRAHGAMDNLELLDRDAAAQRLLQWDRERPAGMSDPRKFMAAMILLGFRRKAQSAGMEQVHTQAHTGANSLQ